MRHARRIDAAGGQVPRESAYSAAPFGPSPRNSSQPAQPAPLFAQIARLDQRVRGRRHRPAVAAVGGFRPRRQRVSPFVGHLRPSAGPRGRTAPRPATRDRCACAWRPHFGRARPNWRRHFGCAQPNCLRPGRACPSARSPQVLLGTGVATKGHQGAARSAATSCGRAACKCARSAARAACLCPVGSATERGGVGRNSPQRGTRQPLGKRAVE